MQVGIALVFQNFEDQLSDAEAYRRDFRLAEQAEVLGYDILASAEHHFSSYGMCPNNMQILTYLAGRTKTIKLLTAAVILPWHKDPLRVVEEMIVLDHLSEGRALFGIGRGLAIKEYQAFGLEMSEARERFEEAGLVIAQGLETGFVEGDGPFYKQIRTEVRPRPYASFKDRLYAVAMSSDSVPAVANLGAHMMVFSQKPWDQMIPHFSKYNELYLQQHKRTAPPPMLADFVVCDESADRAEELANIHLGNYYGTLLEHYDVLGEHFSEKKGYGEYANTASYLRSIGKQEAVDGFININPWGTPTQILEKLEARKKIIGDFDWVLQPSFGGVTYENAIKTMRLVGEKVVPELKSWARR
jgi:alkanesulfonate monooxygenase SsuD/methylene tetrahydromethanopterin reductase-like flavin-dependent oxidoreductase (luciferase family)